jgi:hypothetical protein
MLVYVLRRFAFLVLTLLLTSILIFIITQLLPGDICRVILGREVAPARWKPAAPTWDWIVLQPRAISPGSPISCAATGAALIARTRKSSRK